MVASEVVLAVEAHVEQAQAQPAGPPTDETRLMFTGFVTP